MIKGFLIFLVVMLGIFVIVPKIHQILNPVKFKKDDGGKAEEK
jgi:hypothetical protein